VSEHASVHGEKGRLRAIEKVHICFVRYWSLSSVQWQQSNLFLLPIFVRKKRREREREREGNKKSLATTTAIATKDENNKHNQNKIVQFLSSFDVCYAVER
jgi:hypothetical protein